MQQLLSDVHPRVELPTAALLWDAWDNQDSARWLPNQVETHSSTGIDTACTSLGCLRYSRYMKYLRQSGIKVWVYDALATHSGGTYCGTTLAAQALAYLRYLGCLRIWDIWDNQESGYDILAPNQVVHIVARPRAPLLTSVIKILEYLVYSDTLKIQRPGYPIR